MIKFPRSCKCVRNCVYPTANTLCLSQCISLRQPQLLWTSTRIGSAGCKIFVGGQIGKDAHLSLEPIKSGISLADEESIPILVDTLKTEFGAIDNVTTKSNGGMFSSRPLVE